MRTISYNLREHTASGELEALVRDYDVDLLCLQECDASDLPDVVGGLQMATATKENRLGLAMYYRRDRFDMVRADAFSLKKSLHDRVLTPAHERLIGVKFLDLESDHTLVAGSFHAAPLTASNSLRRHQINAAHIELLGMGKSIATLMVGDFNYPFFTQKLSERMNDAGYDLSLSDRSTYTRGMFFRGHFDFATSRGLDIKKVETLPQGASDHLPILVLADYRDGDASEHGKGHDAAPKVTE
ncbi:endonuclease/exonuclease/phosphatase family protein [Arthrobacter sp. JZ12]|uniref:endonuclease/exonuclease/phosphatase family protein n=1 Tax=Arthrobacter sp. JZ12 TaxID=2654190 RepID=UPI002B474911|nr:endonuclease/exonuclease/phosphatase family protein [Arthrobacter sp. JZ12]WRH24162.1 endonuclease/exonuclease/phosphatase family protein [Arthrobacter sp. JZ12]